MGYDTETNNTENLVDFCRYCIKILRFLPGNNIILWYCYIYAWSQVVRNKLYIYIFTTWWIHIFHIACLISSIFHLMDSHLSYCMSHFKSVSDDEFTFFILHASSQVYSTWCIHIFHIACLISSLFQMMHLHFSYCILHLKSISPDGFTFFIMHPSSSVYSTWWIHILHIACLISSIFHLLDSHFQIACLISSIFHLMDSYFSYWNFRSYFLFAYSSQLLHHLISCLQKAIIKALWKERLNSDWWTIPPISTNPSLTSTYWT
jgi:TM2 domain-containing membrane protein YozV